jgi:hypothetical protein
MLPVKFVGGADRAVKRYKLMDKSGNVRKMTGSIDVLVFYEQYESAVQAFLQDAEG